MPTTHDRFTSADVLEMNNSEKVFGIFNEASRYNPEIRLIGASPCKKTQYKTLVQTGLPTVGFRESNVGIVQGSPTVESRDVFLKFLDASWSLDQKVAKEAEWGQNTAITLCAKAAMEAALQKIAVQTWYGSQADAQGFQGLATLLPYTDAPMVVNAGGTTANAASSIFAIRTELQGVQYAWGQDGSIDVGPIVDAEQWDTAGNKFWAHAQKVQAYIGLQVPSLQVIGRVCNITQQDGKKATDNLIAQLLEKFPVGKEPNLIFMTRRSLEQIRSQRIATTTKGLEVPYPESIFGIPIHVTDALRNNEAILTATPAP
jgi:hypothetical protein